MKFAIYRLTIFQKDCRVTYGDLGMNRLKNSLILLLLAVATVLGGRGTAFAVSVDALQSKTGSIDVLENQGVPITAILTTLSVQNHACFNRMNNFCHNQNAISITKNAVTMTVPEKNTKIDIENTIIVKLRI
jgi:hypothetical protein